LVIAAGGSNFTRLRRAELQFQRPKTTLTETSNGDIGRIRAKRQIQEGFEMRVVALILFALLLSSSLAWAQARKPASLSELVNYMGADREQMLFAGAKAEGKVMWYTSLAGGSYKALIAAFEAKYPGSESRSTAPGAPSCLSG
jgi:hypothetical protein